jgi:hypothetical protein
MRFVGEGTRPCELSSLHCWCDLFVRYSAELYQAAVVILGSPNTACAVILLALDYLRNRVSTERPTLESARSTVIAQSLLHARKAADPDTTAAVPGILRDLKAEERFAFQLSLILRLSCEEVSRQLQIPEREVATLVQSAVTKLAHHGTGRTGLKAHTHQGVISHDRLDRIIDNECIVC